MGYCPQGRKELGVTEVTEHACVLNRFSPSQLCDSIDCSLPVSLSMGFSRKEYWSGLPCPSPRDLPDPGPGLLHCRQILYYCTTGEAVEV